MEELLSSFAEAQDREIIKGLFLQILSSLLENTCILEYTRARMRISVSRSRVSDGSARSPWPGKTHPSLPQEHALGTDRL
jgi:hypothetical protein